MLFDLVCMGCVEKVGVANGIKGLKKEGQLEGWKVGRFKGWGLAQGNGFIISSALKN